MLFNTWTFAAFFSICLIGALGVAKKVRGQNLWLLGLSYLFYGAWDPRFLALIWLSTLVDFGLGLRMASREGAARKQLAWISVVVNLGILGIFKYCGFFVESAASLLRSVGLDPHLPVLEIVLPVGISFYTFQTLAYAIDVARGRIEACRDLSQFALYVCYFPQLVAGPIERAERLLPQLAVARRFDLDRAISGGQLILIGLCRKVLIADVAARSVDRAFEDPGEYDALWLSRAALLFSLQIYGDFAGYSDMARGTSRVLGIELMQNFRRPYFATSITDFWRRWHISLSQWLRDYLYIPLGGNRGTKWFCARNLLLTMLIGGLWHGAAWTFVAWGAIHGLALSVDKFVLGRQQTNNPTDRSRRHVLATNAVGWATTMLVVGIAWVFFRAPDFATAFAVLEGIASLEFTPDPGALKLPAMLLGVLLLIDLPQALARRDDAVLTWPWPMQSLAHACAILALVIFGGTDGPEFLYFQF
ncbi:MAG: MBOAT family protein [Planctomycetota bacterium]